MNSFSSSLRSSHIPHSHTPNNLLLVASLLADDSLLTTTNPLLAAGDNDTPTNDNGNNDDLDNPDDDHNASSASLQPTPARNVEQRWWEKLFFAEYATRKQLEERELEELEAPKEAEKEAEVAEASDLKPSDAKLSDASPSSSPTAKTPSPAVPPSSAPLPSSATPLTPYVKPQMAIPGRRLEGVPTASVVSIPPNLRSLGIPKAKANTPSQKNRQTSYNTKIAVMKHWEMKVAHGIIKTADPSHHNQALIDGRLFFASKQAYPMGVFSVLKYEPRKEEAMRRRRKLEEMGGGGRMYFATEGRDWRGTSYRSIILSQVSEEKVRSGEEERTAGAKRQQKHYCAFLHNE